MISPFIGHQERRDMLVELDGFASNLATLRTIAGLFDEDTRCRVSREIDRIESAFIAISEEPGVLAGEMPWWLEWQWASES